MPTTVRESDAATQARAVATARDVLEGWVSGHERGRSWVDRYWRGPDAGGGGMANIDLGSLGAQRAAPDAAELEPEPAAAPPVGGRNARGAWVDWPGHGLDTGAPNSGEELFAGGSRAPSARELVAMPDAGRDAWIGRLADLRELANIGHGTDEDADRLDRYLAGLENAGMSSPASWEPPDDDELPDPDDDPEPWLTRRSADLARRERVAMVPNRASPRAPRDEPEEDRETLDALAAELGVAVPDLIAHLEYQRNVRLNEQAVGIARGVLEGWIDR